MLRTWLVRLPAIEFTVSVRSRQVPATPGTRAWPPSTPSVPTSRATRVTSSANDESWSTIVLTVLLSSRISPRASTVILRVRSPLATAVVTSAMLRTWEVRLAAIMLTFSVRSFQVPETSCTSAWPPSRPSVPTSRATRVTSSAKDDSWSTIVLTVFLSSRISPRASTVIFRVRSPPRHRGGDLGDVAHLGGQGAGHEVHRVGEVAPGAGDAGHLGLAAQPALAADLAGHPGDLVGERRQLVDHRVDGGLELGELAAHVDGDLLAEVAPGHRGGDLGDVAHLVGQVARHGVHRVGEVLPGAGDAGHVGLAAEDALAAHLAGHPGDLGRRRTRAGRPSC